MAGYAGMLQPATFKEASTLYLHVAPGGVASFTNTKTMQQAALPTAGNTEAKPVTAGSGGDGFFDALSNVESNHRNILSGVDKDYPGQPGSAVRASSRRANVATVRPQGRGRHLALSDADDRPNRRFP